MSRRLLSTLLLGLVLMGCAKEPPAPPPAGEPEAPPPTMGGKPAGDGSGSTTGPSEPPVEPTGKAGLQPEPAGGLKELISQEGEAPVRRITFRPGEKIGQVGLFFLKLATGEVEGWVPASGPRAAGPTWVSSDNRWLGEESYAVDRQSGTGYRWNRQTARLVTARGDLLLFMTGSRYWLVSEGMQRFQPLDLPAAARPFAAIAPDGRSLWLVSDGEVYLVETATGRAEMLGRIGGAEPGIPSIIFNQGEIAVTITTPLFQGRRWGSEILRFRRDGRLLERRTTPGLAYPSPDGKLVAWEGDILGLTHTLTIGSADLSPQLRLRGEMSCSMPFQGPYWLPDASGLVVRTSRGPRLLKLDGSLEPAPSKTDQAWAVPVPAPDRADRFTIHGTAVIDAHGRAVAAAFHDMTVGRLHPWGESSEEIRFILLLGGRGVSCDPDIFPPEVERAPFAPLAGLTVKVAPNDCVNLRASFSKESPVITCLPDGARLTAAEPPGVNNKGELRRWGNPMETGNGGPWWWYVRTEQGQRGWVYLDAEYLTFTVADRPEEPADLLLRRVEDQLHNMAFWLRVASGEQVCGEHCAPGSSGMTAAVAGLIFWCETGPGALGADPAYDPALHGPGLSRLRAACQGLQSAREQIGPPEEGPAWNQRVKELLAQLER
ncbi:MAG: SH3 domain-containing protein [Bacillota bacterium]